MARYLREYYTTPPRLMVQRISGEPLAMQQCYINLALIEREGSGGRDSGDSIAPSSLFSRLKVETVKEGHQVALAQLFDSRASTDGRRSSPRRILIQGRAGVGKTTLCKKIVHDFLYQGMWQEHFNILLWIPLRSLKHISSENATLDKLFHYLFFPNVSQGGDFGNRLQEMVSDPVYRPRTLLVLDGLDEVSQEWNTETTTYNLLQHLLNYPQVIITSRPYGMNLTNSSLDLELEAVGFNTKQVEAYIRKLASHDPDKAASILAFVHKHEVIEGLVRIPVQLDAVCYSWDRGFVGDEEPRTMTSLYETLSLKLWQKDVLRLSTSSIDVGLNEDAIRSLSMLQVQEMIPHEIDLIERLSFAGMCNEIIEFTPDDRHQIYDLLRDQGVTVPDMPEKVMQKISFLHSSDPTVIDGDRSYHFLHLTFQEFFAARYFVRCWNRLEDLLCFGLRQGVPAISRITPQTFLGANKYRSRYNIMWRFVAGLFARSASSVGTRDPLDNFFTQIEAEPRDILGPVHQRLLIHCLSEVTMASQKAWHLAAVERMIYEWTLFACISGNFATFVSAREFPEHLLARLLQDKAAEEYEEEIIKGLLGRETMLPAGVEYLYSQSGDTQVAKAPVFEALSQEALTIAAFDAIIPRLQGPMDMKNPYMWPLVIRLQRHLPQVSAHVLTYLGHDLVNVRETIMEAFGSEQYLAPEIVEALLLFISSTNDTLTLDATRVLCTQDSLIPAAIDHLIQILEGEYWLGRDCAAGILAGQRYPSSKTLQALFGHLRGCPESSCIFNVVALLLGERDVTAATLSLCLNAGDVIAKMALETLRIFGGFFLASDLLELVLEFIGHDDPEMRLYVAEILARQESLPPDIVRSMIPLLSDDDAKTVYLAAIAFYRQPQPSQVHLGVQHNSHSGLLLCVARCLGTQSPVSEDDFQSLQPYLQSGRYSGSGIIASILFGQSSVNWDAVTWLWKYGDSKTVMRVLEDSKEPLPPQVVGTVLEEAFIDPSWYRPRFRFPVTGPGLEIVCSFVVEHDLYNKSIIRDLTLQPILPTAMVEYVIEHLQDRQELPVEEDILLRKHGKLDQDLPVKSWVRLYEAWLKRSFTEQFSCYIVDNCLVLDTPEGMTKVEFGKKQLRAFRHAIRKKQIALGIPVDTVLEESRGDRVKARLTGGLF